MKITCKQCSIELADELVEVLGPGQVREIDDQDFINQGKFFVSDGEYYAGTESDIIINLKDLKNSKNHTDASRLNGCCGLDGMDGRNKTCINGHEIGTEKSDCWMAHAFIFDNDKILVDSKQRDGISGQRKIKRH